MRQPSDQPTISVRKARPLPKPRFWAWQWLWPPSKSANAAAATPAPVPKYANASRPAITPAPTVRYLDTSAAPLPFAYDPFTENQLLQRQALESIGRAHYIEGDITTLPAGDITTWG